MQPLGVEASRLDKSKHFYITAPYALWPFHAWCVLLPSYGSNYWALLCLGIQMRINDQKGPWTSIPSPLSKSTRTGTSTSTRTSTSTSTSTYTEVSGLPCSTLSSSGGRKERERKQGSCSQSCKAVRWQPRVNGKQRLRHVHKVQASGAADASVDLRWDFALKRLSNVKTNSQRSRFYSVILNFTWLLSLFEDGV